MKQIEVFLLFYTSSYNVTLINTSKYCFKNEEFTLPIIKVLIVFIQIERHPPLFHIQISKAHQVPRTPNFLKLFQLSNCSSFKTNIIFLFISDLNFWLLFSVHLTTGRPKRKCGYKCQMTLNDYPTKWDVEYTCD